MAQDDPFARDLGYLAKFFDALRSHAGTLDPVARQRLLSLLDEEGARWAEIRQLLVGGTPDRPGTPAAAAAQARSGGASPGFTVGSLLSGHSAPR